MAYNPSGTFDVDDIDNGTIIDGSWRLYSSDTAVRDYVGHTPCDNDNAHDIPYEFKEYFVSNESHMHWQDHCA